MLDHQPFLASVTAVAMTVQCGPIPAGGSSWKSAAFYNLADVSAPFPVPR